MQIRVRSCMFTMCSVTEYSKATQRLFSQRVLLISWESRPNKSCVIFMQGFKNHQSLRILEGPRVTFCFWTRVSKQWWFLHWKVYWVQYVFLSLDCENSFIQQLLTDCLPFARLWSRDNGCNLLDIKLLWLSLFKNFIVTPSPSMGYKQGFLTMNFALGRIIL